MIQTDSPPEVPFSVQFCHGSLTFAFIDRKLCSLCQEIWKPNSVRTILHFSKETNTSTTSPYHAKCRAHTKQKQNPGLPHYLDKSPTEFTLELLPPKGIVLEQRLTPIQDTSICSPTFIPGSIPQATGLLVLLLAFAGKLPQIQHDNMWTAWVFFSLSSYLFKQMLADGFTAGCFYIPGLITISWTYSCNQLRIFPSAMSSLWTHLNRIPIWHINFSI